MLASTLEAPVLIIGSAHVVDLASPLRSALSERPLDAIALELDVERAASVLGPPTSDRRSASAPFIMKIWAAVQRRLGEEMGAGLPGAEMRTAAELARERGIPLLLVDDPIRETLARLVRSLSVRERVSLLFGAIVGLIIPTRFVERQLDRYADSPDDYLSEVRRAYPTVARVLLDDRNEHMATRIATMRTSGYGRIAAVVGDAHVSGLAAALRRRSVPVETLAFRELRAATGPSAGPS